MSEDAAGVDNAVGADFAGIADNGAEFFEARVDDLSIVPDLDGGAVEFEVGEDDAGAEMSFVTEDAVADVGEVRNLDVVEEDAVFEFAAVAEDAGVTGDDIFADVGALADGAIGADPRGPHDGDTRFNDGIRADVHLLADVRFSQNFASIRRFEVFLEIIRNF